MARDAHSGAVPPARGSRQPAPLAQRRLDPRRPEAAGGRAGALIGCSAPSNSSCARSWRHSYRREVIEGTSRNWCPQWWRHAEAISRLEALVASVGAPASGSRHGMSVWWRDHADHHMAVLSTRRPFQDVLGARRPLKQDFEVVPL
ncbi:DUF4913 domain-containing protein, partial [Rhodococcus hoagii]|nr:DUF4913 domain-containing protein [Prescottella equi]